MRCSAIYIACAQCGLCQQDRDAYIAGERAAITRSLQMMLPSQQQLGALSSGLQKLEYMVSEEATRARHMQSATVELSTVAQV